MSRPPIRPLPPARRRPARPMRSSPSRYHDLLAYRRPATDVVELVLGATPASDFERDALNRIGIASASLLEALDELSRASANA